VFLAAAVETAVETVTVWIVGGEVTNAAWP
jgi:hypothetical protein